jgi:hypothetical protein
LLLHVERLREKKKRERDQKTKTEKKASKEIYSFYLLRWRADVYSTTTTSSSRSSHKTRRAAAVAVAVGADLWRRYWTPSVQPTFSSPHVW